MARPQIKTADAIDWAVREFTSDGNAALLMRETGAPAATPLRAFAETARPWLTEMVSMRLSEGIRARDLVGALNSYFIASQRDAARGVGAPERDAARLDALGGVTRPTARPAPTHCLVSGLSPEKEAAIVPPDASQLERLLALAAHGHPIPHVGGRLPAGRRARISHTLPPHDEWQERTDGLESRRRRGAAHPAATRLHEQWFASSIFG